MSGFCFELGCPGRRYCSEARLDFAWTPDALAVHFEMELNAPAFGFVREFDTPAQHSGLGFCLHMSRSSL